MVFDFLSYLIYSRIVRSVIILIILGDYLIVMIVTGTTVKDYDDNDYLLKEEFI